MYLGMGIKVLPLRWVKLPHSAGPALKIVKFHFMSAYSSKIFCNHKEVIKVKKSKKQYEKVVTKKKKNQV